MFDDDDGKDRTSKCAVNQKITNGPAGPNGSIVEDLKIKLVEVVVLVLCASVGIANIVNISIIYQRWYTQYISF